MKETLKEKMKKRFARILVNESGVTLIELLAVVVILAIIAAVAVPAVMGNFKNAKANTDSQNMQIIQDAVSRFMVENPDAAIQGSGGPLTHGGTGEAQVKITSSSSAADLYDTLTSASTNGGPFLQSIPTPQDSTKVFSVDTKGTVSEIAKP